MNYNKEKKGFELAKCLSICLCAVLTSCASGSAYKYAATSQNEVLVPENSEEYFKTENVEVKQGEEDPEPTDVTSPLDLENLNDSKLSLVDLMDIGLTNSPATRATWATARAQAANYGRSLSTYYPYIDTSAEGAFGEISQLQGGRSYLNVGAALTYILLDFGRSHKAEAAKQALAAANWQHNQAIQDLLFNIPKAYYNFMGSVSLIEASKKSLKEAQTTVRATEARRKAGVSTIADVLQARSNSAQAKLELVQNEGNSKIYKGQLATAVGWQADRDFGIDGKNQSLPMTEMSASVNQLVEKAKQTRPDIAAARASLLQAKAALYEARALSYPQLTGTGNTNWERMKNTDTTSYYGGFQLQVPIFHGFDFRNAAKAARADLELAEAQYESEKNDVVEDVWNAYNNFKTASESLKTSKSLMSSASESFRVSLARYKAGAADIVELLNAQSMLANARSQEINSRMDVFKSYADLIHAVGTDLSQNTIVMTNYVRDREVEE